MTVHLASPLAAKKALKVHSMTADSGKAVAAFANDVVGVQRLKCFNHITGKILLLLHVAANSRMYSIAGIARKQSQYREQFDSLKNYESFHKWLSRAAKYQFPQTTDALQDQIVAWLRSRVEPRAAAWFQTFMTGERGGCFFATCQTVTEGACRTISRSKAGCCWTKAERCRTKAERCQTKAERCRTNAERCRTKEERCRTNAERCRTNAERCWSKAERCRTKAERCRTKEERCRTKEERCQTKAERCRTNAELF